MSEIAFKNLGVLKGMFTYAWHPILISLLLWIKVRYSKESVLITCAYEDRDRPSCHCTSPLRAFDMRSWTFSEPQKVADDINSAWTYDPSRPKKKVAIYHDTGRGPHIHLQVHDKTVINTV